VEDIWTNTFEEEVGYFSKTSRIEGFVDVLDFDKDTKILEFSSM
jgi:hypothetical protein